MKHEIKYIFYVIGVVVFIFFVGFFVRGCIDKNRNIKTNNDYRTTIETIEKQLEIKSNTIQRITKELQTASGYIEQIEKTIVENSKRIDELKRTNCEDTERIDVIKEAVKRIKQEITK